MRRIRKKWQCRLVIIVPGLSVHVLMLDVSVSVCGPSMSCIIHVRAVQYARANCMLWQLWVSNSPTAFKVQCIVL